MKKEDMTLTQAKEEIAKGHRMFKALDLALEAVTALEHAQQGQKEAEARVVKLKAEGEKLSDQVSKAVQKLKATEERIAQAERDVEVNMTKIISEAQAEAVGILNKAKGEADDVATTTEEGRVALSIIRSDIDKAQAELTALNDRKAEALKKITGALGG